MKITIIKIQRQASKLGGSFWYLFGKTEEGMSVKSCLYENFRNFQRWKPVLGLPSGSVIDVNIIRGNLIDADSFPKVVING